MLQASQGQVVWVLADQVVRLVAVGDLLVVLAVAPAVVAFDVVALLVLLDARRTGAL